MTPETGGKSEPTEDLHKLQDIRETLRGLAAPLGEAGRGLQAASAMLAGKVGAAPSTSTGFTGLQGTSSITDLTKPVVPEMFSGLLTNIFSSVGKSSMDDKQSADKTKALSTQVADEQIANDAALIESDRKVWAAKLANAIAGSKKLAKVNKAYSISAAIINTATGITRTFSKLGFPAAIVPATALAARGAQEIATIKGQTHAGLDKIPSTGTYLLERGERVVGKRLNQDLSDFLNSTSDNGFSGTIDRSITRSSNFNPTINLSINGGVAEDALLANRGAIESMIRDIYADYAQEAPFGV